MGALDLWSDAFRNRLFEIILILNEIYELNALEKYLLEEGTKVLSNSAVKDFFAKGRGVLLGFSLILLGALLITVNKILGSLSVLIGIIFLTLSDYISESEEDEWAVNKEGGKKSE